MNVVLVIACIGLIAGSFILFSISLMEFTNSIFRNILGKPRSIKDEINEATKRKKMSFFRREVTEVHDVLKLTGREQKFPALCAVSLFLFATGCTIAVMLDNIFLIPVLAVGFMFLPFWYVRLTQSHFKKDIAAELETALSIVTTAYLRTEDILTAVEENINYLNPPVLSVFKGFVYRIKMINPDITASLQDMRGQIENAVFREWCDALIACQLDRSLKTTLTPIVTKLSDMRVVNGELENMVFEPRKEFIAMQILVIGNIPLLYFLNKDWYHTLMHTAIGQIILAICFTAVFISAAFVIRLTQPIEYRR
ncbi:MAG: type II secretion system F family protein [Ruminiclostridium sp.]